MSLTFSLPRAARHGARPGFLCIRLRRLSPVRPLWWSKHKFVSHLCLILTYGLPYPVLLLQMKQTPEDLRFAGDFAEALRPHVANGRKRGRALKQIAEELGVTEPALKKYLSGRTTPCLRTVVLAYDRYGVSVPYSGVSFAGGGPHKRRRRKQSSPLQQLFLPFDIQTPSSDDRLALKLLPTGVGRYQLQVLFHLAR